MLTIQKRYVIFKSARGERLDLLHRGGDNMSFSEVMELLRFLAVVIFEVIKIKIAKKK